MLQCGLLHPADPEMFRVFSISNAAGWVTYGKLKKEKYSSPDSIATDGEGELHSKNWGPRGWRGRFFFLAAQKTAHFGSEQDET